MAVNIAVEDPKNDFLVVTNYYEGNTGFRFNVSNEKFNISWKPAEKDAQGNTIQYTSSPRLWRVNVPEMSVQEITLLDKNGKTAQVLSIPGITDVKVVNLTPGPDGYEYVDASRYNSSGNLMTEIFGGHSSQRRLAGIAKNGRLVTFRIPDGRDYYSYNDNQFIGWIVEEGTAQ